MRILLVEDDMSLVQGLQQPLRHDAFVVNLINNGKRKDYILRLAIEFEFSC